MKPPVKHVLRTGDIAAQMRLWAPTFFPPAATRVTSVAKSDTASTRLGSCGLVLSALLIVFMMFMVATCGVARTGPSEAREIPEEGYRENKMEMDRAKWSGMDGSL